MPNANKHNIKHRQSVKGKTRARTIWIFSIFTGTLFCALFFQAGSFLASPAREPVQADAIVVLAGNAEPRSIKGLELFKIGFADLILLTVPEKTDPHTPLYSNDPRATTLIAGGVRKEAIEFIELSGNSWQEARNTLKFAKERNLSRIIVVSDPPHMRRLEWIWGRLFKDTGISLTLVSGAPTWWDAEKWWANWESAKFVYSEYVKIVYYRLKY